MPTNKCSLYCTQRNGRDSKSSFLLSFPSSLFWEPGFPNSPGFRENEIPPIRSPPQGDLPQVASFLQTNCAAARGLSLEPLTRPPCFSGLRLCPFIAFSYDTSPKSGIRLRKVFLGVLAWHQLAKRIASPPPNGPTKMQLGAKSQKSTFRCSILNNFSKSNASALMRHATFRSLAPSPYRRATFRNRVPQ